MEDTQEASIASKGKMSVQEGEESQDMTGQHVGWLFKRGRIMKNWKKRFFVLRLKELTYYNDENNVKSKRGSIDLNDCTSLVLSQSGSLYIIYIKTPDRVLQLRSRDEEGTKLWYDSLKIAMQQRIIATKQNSFMITGPGEGKTIVLSGFLGKSKVIYDWHLEDSQEQVLRKNTSSRWSTFTMRYFVLVADKKTCPEGEDKVSYTLSYYTDATCKTQRGSLKIENSFSAAFQTTKVPWKQFAEQDLKFESPIYITLTCDTWFVVLCPKNEEDALQWRTAFDTIIYQIKTQEGLQVGETLQKVA